MGSSSLTKDRTEAACTGSMESQPLDHQGSPWFLFYNFIHLFIFIFGCAGSLLLFGLFSSYSLVAVCRLLIVLASLVEHRL